LLDREISEINHELVESCYQKLILRFVRIGIVPISNEDVVLQNLMNTMIFVALEDNVITEDELAILKQLKLDLTEIRNKVSQIDKNSEFTNDDAKKLDEFTKDILQNAYDISKNDHIINDDERKLINALIRALLK